jgi:zona occludens toxin
MDVVRQMVPDAQLEELPLQRIEQDPPSLLEYAKPGCVLIIDECWRLWPAGQKADKVPTPFKQLLAEHRHMVDEAGNAMQIVLVTQDLAQIAAFARQLVEQTFHHTKLTHVGASGSYRVDVYQGPRTGANLPRDQRIREIFGRYDRSVFKVYQSHTMSQAAGSGANEKSMDGRGNIWRRPMFWVTAGACLVFLVWGIPKAVQLLHNPTGRELRPASVATGPQPSAVGAFHASAPAAVASRPALTWRVSGVAAFEEEGQGFAILERSDGATVRVDLRSCQVMEFETRCNYDGGRWSTIAPRPAPAPASAVAPSQS